MRTRDQGFWLIVLSKLMRLPEPWGKATEKVATDILWRCEGLAGKKDLGWYVAYIKFGDEQWWPWAIAPDGKRHDLRKLAGLL